MITAQLFTANPIPVQILDVFEGADGRRKAEVMALNNHQFAHYTHGGWAYDNIEIVNVDLLHNIAPSFCPLVAESIYPCLTCEPYIRGRCEN